MEARILLENTPSSWLPKITIKLPISEIPKTFYLVQFRFELMKKLNLMILVNLLIMGIPSEIIDLEFTGQKRNSNIPKSRQPSNLPIGLLQITPQC